MTTPQPRHERPHRSDTDERVRQQWQLTFDLTSQGIALLDPRTGCMERVNSAFAGMHGGVPEDFTGRPVATTLTELWQQRIPEIVTSIHGRGSRTFECDRVRRDGSTFPTSTEVVAARSPEGELLYRLVFATDLTELRAREASERQAVDRFEHVFEEAPVGMVLLRAGMIERVNAAAGKILGRQMENLVGIDHRLVAHLADAPVPASDCVAEDPRSPTQDQRITHPDGRVSHIRCSYSVLHERLGAAGPLVLVVMEDRTTEVEARAAEDQLRIVEARGEIARDLHDHAIQHLFAIGIAVQSIVATLPDSVHARRLETMIDDVDNTIRGIRVVIQTLQPSAIAL